MSSAGESSYGQSRKRDKPSEAFRPKLYSRTSHSNKGSHPFPPPPPPPLHRSFSGFNKDDDLNWNRVDTDNVTGQRIWRQQDLSVESSARPRLFRKQPRSGIETFSPPEAPNLQGTVYSSSGRQLSEGILKNMAQLAVTPDSRIGSEALSHPRELYHLGGLAPKATTQTSTHFNTEQVQQYSSEAVNNNSTKSQKGAFYPVHTKSGPPPPNYPIPDSSSRRYAPKTPADKVRLAREKNPNRDPFPGSGFFPNQRCGDYTRGGTPLPKVADDQKQAISSKSSLSDLHANGLRGGLDSRESSQSPHPNKTRIKSSSPRELKKSNHPWSYSLPGDWTPSKPKMKIRNDNILGKTLKSKGYVDATTSKGLVRKIIPEKKRNNLRGRDDRKSNYRDDHRKKNDSRSSEQLDDESVEGLSYPASPHQFDTRSLRSTR
ncbi:hypothetical protein ACHAQE_007714 [Botrytis cinerea]